MSIWYSLLPLFVCKLPMRLNRLVHYFTPSPFTGLEGRKSFSTNMSDMHSAVFNASQRVGASHEFTLDGSFNRRDALLPPLVAWNRQRTVRYCNFFNKMF
jgi:hypothetical protein